VKSVGFNLRPLYSQSDPSNSSASCGGGGETRRAQRKKIFRSCCPTLPRRLVPWHERLWVLVRRQSFKRDIHLNNIGTISFYRAENTMSLHYRDGSVFMFRGKYSQNLLKILECQFKRYCNKLTSNWSRKLSPESETNVKWRVIKWR
jgi:hypothetical protein